MNKDKYILELNAEQVFILFDILRRTKVYQSSYEPLRELVKTVGIICKDVKRIPISYDLVNN